MSVDEIYKSVEEFYKEIRNKINGLLRRTRFISRGESWEYARDIGRIRFFIEEEILPYSPELAWRLADKVIKKDDKLLDACDDSNGVVGDELREFVYLWVDSAVLLNKKDSYWKPRVIEQVDNNSFGIKDNLLVETKRLLSRDALLELYNSWKAEYLNHLGEKSDDSFSLDGINYEAKLCETALALDEPEKYLEVYLLDGSEINELQMMTIVKVFIDFKLYERAEELLNSIDCRDRLSDSYSELYKLIYKETGNRDGLILECKKKWNKDSDYSSLKEYLNVISEKEKEKIISEAINIAIQDEDIYRGAMVLLELDNFEKAEELIITHKKELNHLRYDKLLDILDKIALHSDISQVLIYRSLLDDILNRGFSKGYNHAAKYFKQLVKLEQVVEYGDRIENHTDYNNKLKEKHFRKHAFWRRIE